MPTTTTHTDDALPAQAIAWDPSRFMGYNAADLALIQLGWTQALDTAYAAEKRQKASVPPAVLAALNAFLFDFGQFDSDAERLAEFRRHRRTARAISAAVTAVRPQRPRNPRAAEIYDSFLAVIQSAEEMGGPEGQDYLDLMTAIGAETIQRVAAAAGAMNEVAMDGAAA